MSVNNKKQQEELLNYGACYTYYYRAGFSGDIPDQEYASGDVLLLESGDNLLLENGDDILIDFAT